MFDTKIKSSPRYQFTRKQWIIKAFILIKRCDWCVLEPANLRADDAEARKSVWMRPSLGIVAFLPITVGIKCI